MSIILKSYVEDRWFTPENGYVYIQRLLNVVADGS